MPETLTLNSPAKLNLMLHITGQREDGYHNLQTAFQFIGLYDELTFEFNDSGAVQRFGDNQDIPEQDDLIIKAARLLKKQTPTSFGVDITIKKHIPIGGGLGGGSSNAATTLMALNKLWGLGLNQAQLQQLGVQLGADVPIFIFGQSAWAEGVGDLLTPINLPENWFFVLHPQVFVSTGQIFSSKHLTRDSHPIKIRAFLEGEGRNVCEPVACELYPEIQSAIDWLSRFSPARMTGTGACVFAAFDSAEKANTVQSQLPQNWTGYVVQGLSHNPVTQICLSAD
mgnify:CR=1 FL=1